MRRYILPVLLLLCAGIFSGQGLERDGARQIGGFSGRAVPTDIADQPPVAWFTVSQTDSATYFFNAEASSDREAAISQYDWYFGDGDSNKTNTSTVSHAYSSSDTFEVKLRVTDSNSAINVKTRNVVVDITSEAPNQLPVIAGSAVDNNLSFYVNLSGSYDPDGTIAAYAIDATNSELITPAVPDTTLSTPYFAGSYSSSATGVETLTVKCKDNDGGWSDTLDIPLVIFDGTPTALLDYDIVNLQLYAYGEGSTDPDSNITTYIFNFGDGTEASGTDPVASHLYASAGTYTVTLTVRDSDSNLDSVSQVITVSAALVGPSLTANWAGYKSLTIDAAYYKSGVVGKAVSHDSFPLLITGECLWYDGVWDGAKADGSDIVIVAESDTLVALTRNIVSWTPADSTAEIWVKAPIVTDAQRTWRVYYGNADTTITNGDPWRDSYKMVYHFEENPSLEMPVDASGSGHHITERYGTWIEGDGHTDYGKIGKGLHYNDDGSAEGKTTRSNSYSFTGDSITISGWIYTTDNWEPLYHSYVAGKQNELYVPQAHQGSNASRVRNVTQDQVQVWFKPQPVPHDTWKHHAFVFDWAGQRMYHYYNGQSTIVDYVTDGDEAPLSFDLVDYYPYTSKFVINDTYGIFSRRWNFGTDSTDENLNGHGDEFHIYEGALSSGWIELEYNNQNDPPAFFGIVAPDPPADTTPPIFTTVSHTYPKTIVAKFNEALTEAAAELDANWDVYKTSLGIDSTLAVTSFVLNTGGDSTEVTLTQTENLLYTTKYTVRSNNIEDAAGTPNAAGVMTKDFTTQAAPSPGTPAITSGSSTGADGDAVTIGGTDFGTHGLDLVFGGGADGWIESNADGTTISSTNSGWAKSVVSQSETPPKISTGDAYSGTKSVTTSIDDDVGWTSGGASGFRYFKAATFDKIYVSWWYKLEMPTAPSDFSRHKMFRIWGNNNDFSFSANGSVTGAWFWRQWWLANGQVTGVGNQFLCALQCGTSNDQALCWNEEFSQGYDEEHQAPVCDYISPANTYYCNGEAMVDQTQTLGEWTRFEVYADASDFDTPNGTFRVTLWKPGKDLEHASWVSGLVTHRSEWCYDYPDPWDVWDFQNAHLGPAPGGDFVDWWDDIYIQFGTEARVVIGDNATYSLCKLVETQKPTVWEADGTSITFNLNFGGSFNTDDTAYIFVINSDGEVNGSGYSFTVGSAISF